jgi:ankyrin repeat protein
MSISKAANSGDLQQMRALLDAGGDPNEKETEEHWPPLLEAAYHDHADVARLLLDAGADMSAPTEGGETPLLMAVQCGSLGVFRLLVERGYKMDAVRDNAAWMLTQAAGKGQIEMVRWLLAQGVAVDASDDQGCTALTYAAHSGHLEVVEALLRAGADVNHRDNDTETVLMWTADHAGNAAMLRALLRAGAEVNARSDTGGTALSWTVWIGEHGDPEMARILLDAGAEANDSQVLTRAAYHGFAPIVRMLLERGVDISATDSWGDTALALARKRGHHEVAHLLRQAEADRRLQETGRTYPPPHYPMGTRVRARTGTPREGRVVLAEWNHKHGRYGYYIEVEGKTRTWKMVSRRYWEEDLEALRNEYPSMGDTER